MDGFHPDKSRVSASSLADFIRAPISGDLTEVPGIGAANARALKDAGVSTTFALIGKYLSLKEDGVQPVEHTDRFYYWLGSVEKYSKGHRAGTVAAVAEKMNCIFPGLYEADAYIVGAFRPYNP